MKRQNLIVTQVESIIRRPPAVFLQGAVFSFMTAVLWGGMPNVVRAAYVIVPTPTTNVTASSFFGSRQPYRVSDWSGMSPGTQTQVPGNASNVNPDNTNWLSNNAEGAGTWIRWNLGAVYTIDALHGWNYNENSDSLRNRGISAFTLQTSSDGSSWATVSAIDWSNTLLYKAPNNASDPGFDFTLPSQITTQWIRFDAPVNFPGADSFVGFAEIAFHIAEAPAVPEPSTYVLGLIGLAGLGLVALRKKYRRV